MLTNEEEDSLRKCLRWLNDNPESDVEDCMSIADVAGFLSELLTLREAVAPQMAEVDALEKKWNGPLLIDDEGLVIGEIFSTLRAAILACEREKQRADEAATERDQWKNQCESECQYGYLRQDELDAMKAEIESLTSQLSSIRDAGDEEVTLIAVGLSNDMSCGGIGVMNSILKLRDIAISRGQTRTDAVNKAAEWAKECEGLQEQVATITAERDEVVGLLKWLVERICWKLKWGWVLYMQHVGDKYVTEFWKHKRTGEGKSRRIRWQ